MVRLRSSSTELILPARRISVLFSRVFRLPVGKSRLDIVIVCCTSGIVIPYPSILAWLRLILISLSCPPTISTLDTPRSEEHTSELQSRENLVCRLLLEKKNILEN